MIVVDTSVWIAATRDPTSDLATILDGLIDADEACLAAARPAANCSAALARAIDRSFAEAWLPFQLRFQLKARGTRWRAGSRPVATPASASRRSTW